MMQLTIITCACSQWTNNRLSTESVLSQARRPPCSTSDRKYRQKRFKLLESPEGWPLMTFLATQMTIVSPESQDVGRGVSACHAAVKLIAMLCLISSSEHATKSSTSVLCKCTSCVVPRFLPQNIARPIDYHYCDRSITPFLRY